MEETAEPPYHRKLCLYLCVLNSLLDEGNESPRRNRGCKDGGLCDVALVTKGEGRVNESWEVEEGGGDKMRNDGDRGGEKESRRRDIIQRFTGRIGLNY